MLKNITERFGVIRNQRQQQLTDVFHDRDS